MNTPPLATIFAIFHFEAAHRLENVPDGHKCKRLHGHTYEVRVSVTGMIDPRLGWVIDYAAVEQAWTLEVFQVVDHQYLNEVLPELKGNTTSEWLAWWILGRLRSWLDAPGVRPDPLRFEVEVWETATCGARASS